LIGYMNPNLKQKYAVKNELLDHIVKNIDNLPFESAIMLLE